MIVTGFLSVSNLIEEVYLLINIFVNFLQIVFFIHLVNDTNTAINSTAFDLAKLKIKIAIDIKKLSNYLMRKRTFDVLAQNKSDILALNAGSTDTEISGLVQNFKRMLV